MSATLEVRYVSADASEIRMDTTDPKSVKLVGHAAVFSSLSGDLGGFTERVIPGAFTDTLLKNPDVLFLVNHSGLPLARTSSKTLSLTQDSRGLAFIATLNADDPDTQRIIPKILRGDLTSMSFAFRCIQDNWITDKNGGDIRELRAVDLEGGDISCVSQPAYAAANVGIRSLDNLDQVRAAHQQYRSRIEAEATEIAKKNRGMSLDHARRLLALCD